METLSVVLVDFFPPGDGLIGNFLVPAVIDFLVPAFPFWGDSFLPADLLGVYLAIFSEVYFTSLAESTDLLPAAAAALLALAPAFEAAFCFLLAPPLTLADPVVGSASVFLSASLPFSWIKMSWSLRTGVLPSLKVKSLNSSSPFLPAAPLKLTTPLS